MRAGGPCGSNIFGRIVGPLGALALEAGEPGAQISDTAACAMDGAHNAQATTHIARKLPVKNRFMKRINTVALYTLNCAAGEIYCVGEIFSARCGIEMQFHINKKFHAIQTRARKKMPETGIEPARPVKDNGF